MGLCIAMRMARRHRLGPEREIIINNDIEVERPEEREPFGPYRPAPPPPPMPMEPDFFPNPADDIFPQAGGGDFFPQPGGGDLFPAGGGDLFPQTDLLQAGQSLCSKAKARTKELRAVAGARARLLAAESTSRHRRW
mmetsp:Transcript_55103/g.131320  ORF Transcript_55103/g.131320 Transcript_55103/m.131320 type:complete len:137 (-) Transcript_55103:314-724(-)